MCDSERELEKGGGGGGGECAYVRACMQLRFQACGVCVCVRACVRARVCVCERERERGGVRLCLRASVCASPYCARLRVCSSKPNKLIKTIQRSPSF